MKKACAVKEKSVVGVTEKCYGESRLTTQLHEHQTDVFHHRKCSACALMNHTDKEAHLPKKVEVMVLKSGINKQHKKERVNIHTC